MTFVRILIVGTVSFALLLLWLAPVGASPSWVPYARDAWSLVAWQLSWLVPATVMALVPAFASLLLRRRVGLAFITSLALFLPVAVWLSRSTFSKLKLNAGVSAAVWFALEGAAIALFLAFRLRIRRPHRIPRHRWRRWYARCIKGSREFILRRPFLAQFLVCWPHAILLAKVRRWEWLYRTLLRFFNFRPVSALRRRSKPIGWRSQASPQLTQQQVSEEPQARCIAFCFDGTWNHPAQMERGQNVQTNVYRLWAALDGTDEIVGSPQSAASLEKRLTPTAGQQQIALYYAGIGNEAESSRLGEWLGGVTGYGEREIRDRAYNDLIKIYQPGDRLYVFGFSRGAATARMFTDQLEKKGIPERVVTVSLAGRAFSIFRKERAPELKGAPGDVRIRELGIWDTVGSFVIPHKSLQRAIPGKSLDVSWIVDRAIHMVAIDEDRVAFDPTLLNEGSIPGREREEWWFPGVHSNVGGGHVDQRLADLTLEYLVRKLEGRRELKFKSDWSQRLALNPDPLGEIRTNVGPLPRAYRRIPVTANIHPSVSLRMDRASRQHYSPPSLYEYARLKTEQEKKAGYIRNHIGPSE